MSGIEDCLAAPSLNKGEGLRVVCIRETLRDLKAGDKIEASLRVAPKCP